MGKNQPVLVTDRLAVKRNGLTLIHSVTWRVMPGEHWVILGPNGCGKTSLLSALTGYLMPSAGSITLLGRQYGNSDWPALRRQIGWVSSRLGQMMADDEPALESVVTGKYAMIDFRGRMTAADRAKARGLLRQVECEYLSERPWGLLSQGERQRVLIGRALMADPRLLILDEPCAGLDPVARERFLSFLCRFGRQREAPSIILVTHHVEEIMPLFTHVLLMNRGHVVAAEPREKVLTSTRLSEAFETPVCLRSTRTGWRMEVKA